MALTYKGLGNIVVKVIEGSCAEELQRKLNELLEYINSKYDMELVDIKYNEVYCPSSKLGVHSDVSYSAILVFSAK